MDFEKISALYESDENCASDRGETIDLRDEYYSYVSRFDEGHKNALWGMLIDLSKKYVKQGYMYGFKSAMDLMDECKRM